MAAILKMAAILSAIMNIKWKFRFKGFLNADTDTKNLNISQCSEVLDSKLLFVVFQGGHFKNGGHFVRHFDFLAGQRYFSKQLGILSLHAKFHVFFFLVGTSAPTRPHIHTISGNLDSMGF